MLDFQSLRVFKSRQDNFKYAFTHVEVNIMSSASSVKE